MCIDMENKHLQSDVGRCKMSKTINLNKFRVKDLV